MPGSATRCFLREDFAAALPGDRERQPAGLLEWARTVADAATANDLYRDKNGRRTLRFELGGRSYFLKLHGGVGWREILKNLLRARMPVLGAADEYAAVNALRQAGIETLSVAAFTSDGVNPARRQSLLVSDELVGTVSLETYCAGWAQSPPPAAQRRRLVRKLAQIARGMHGAGINHRDFYLCHFHLDPNTVRHPSPRCYLIDLHRAQLRPWTPDAARLKDLAALYFSALDCGLSRNDRLRFIEYYSGDLRATLRRDGDFWRRVELRALRLYARGKYG